MLPVAHPQTLRPASPMVPILCRFPSCTRSLPIDGVAVQGRTYPRFCPQNARGLRSVRRTRRQATPSTHRTAGLSAGAGAVPGGDEDDGGLGQLGGAVPGAGPAPDLAAI